MIARPRPVSRAEARERAVQMAPILRLTSLSLIIAILGAVAVSVPDQAHEALRIMLEEQEDGRRLTVVTFVLATLGAALLAWYSTRILLYLLLPESQAYRGAQGWAVRNLPRLWGMIPFLGSLWGIFQTIRHDPGSGLRGELAILGGVIAVLGIATFLFFVYRQGILLWIRRKIGRPVSPESDEGILAERGTRPAPAPGVDATQRSVSRVSDLPWLTKWLARLAPLAWILMCAMVIATEGRALAWMGTLGVVLISISSWIIIANTILYGGARLKLPLVKMVAGWWLVINACNLTDNHALRRLEDPPQPIAHPLYSDAFKRWLETRADRGRYGDGAYPVFLVASEGGGLRNAYITAAVLGYLQEWCPGFAQHTFAITSVSGGSIGAATFAALTAHRRAPNGTEVACRDRADTSARGSGASFVHAADTVLSRDFLTPLLAKFLYPDLAQRFIPFRLESWDRARALEVGLDRSWQEAMGASDSARTGMPQSFYALPVDSSTLSVPALMLNTTHVQSGARMVVSHLRPDPADFNGLPSLAHLDSSLHPPLSTAAFLSARFPFVTPEGAITVHDTVKRFVDGGYFDNSGATTAAEMLSAIPFDSVPPIRVVVIMVGFTNRDKYTDQGLNEVLTPLRTLMNTRDARGVTAVSQLETLAKRMSARNQRAEVLEIYLPALTVPLPLGWLLSARARETMRDSLAPGVFCKAERDRRRAAGDTARSCGYDRIYDLLTTPDQPR